MTTTGDFEALEEELRTVSCRAGTREFRDAGKAFEEALRNAHLPRDARASLWGRYQEAWKMHRRLQSAREAASAEAKRRYLSQLNSLDYNYDGLPIGQNFANWERVGEKIRACRGEIIAMQSTLKTDPDLLHNDRKEIRQRIETLWSKIAASEGTTFVVHAERADRLYSEAHGAVERLSVREAAPILKAAANEFHSLWLERGLRERMQGWFDKLFATLANRYEEGKQKHAEWRGRQQEGVERLRAAREKAREALSRIEANVRANRERLASARSDEHAARVSGWIEEGEEKARDIERSLEELDGKIRDAENRLNE